jgi:hypothetical protein
MHNTTELRTAKRYQLGVQALFLWAPQDGKPQIRILLFRPSTAAMELSTFTIPHQTERTPLLLVPELSPNPDCPIRRAPTVNPGSKIQSCQNLEVSQ